MREELREREVEEEEEEKNEKEKLELDWRETKLERNRFAVLCLSKVDFLSLRPGEQRVHRNPAPEMKIGANRGLGLGGERAQRRERASGGWPKARERAFADALFFPDRRSFFFLLRFESSSPSLEKKQLTGLRRRHVRDLAGPALDDQVRGLADRSGLLRVRQRRARLGRLKVDVVVLLVRLVFLICF